MTDDKLIALAKQAGASCYTSRHYPDRPAHTFNLGSLHQFVRLVRADHTEQHLDMVAAPPQPCTCPTRDHLDATLTKVINRRATIEQELFDMAAGKLPMPDAAKLRDMAMRLGDPSLMPAPKP